MSLSIATWNMNHWQGSAAKREAGWSYLREQLRPDIAMLQETVVPVDIPHPIHRAEGIDQHRLWGSALVSWKHQLTEVTHVKSVYHKAEVELVHTHPGTVAAADVEIKGHAPLTVVSIYGMLQQGYSITTMHRILSDLTPLFDSRRYRRIVLGGDFNCSTQLEPPHRERHRNLFERLKAFGLVDLVAMTADSRPALANCPCDDDPCRHVQTHRHNRSGVSWHDDYLFASEVLAEKVTEVRVIDQEPGAREFSDHCPIVAKFEL